MENEPQQKQDAKASEPFPFQSNPYGAARGLNGVADGGDAPKISGDGGAGDQGQTVVNSNSNIDGVANGPTQQPISSKHGDNVIANHDILQQKAEIIQQSNESEIIVDNAPVTVPTIGNSDQGDGDSI